jgi:valyl-tRNA synthetase
MTTEPAPNPNELAKVYVPKQVEKQWYQTWTKRGYFKASAGKKKKPYTIVIPPPNVTDILHMEHALNNTIQDILIRFKRMQGRERGADLRRCELM